MTDSDTFTDDPKFYEDSIREMLAKVDPAFVLHCDDGVYSFTKINSLGGHECYASSMTLEEAYEAADDIALAHERGE